ncbi:LPXTG cell wall anchor domain-containing protein [Facklamia sp. P9177]|uniref:LPXTG cell wall anchor domain-containing protein n=1 Tax=Facklamia sp. P9177 TaxID=3421945 RepID=UPI003D17D147
MKKLLLTSVAALTVAAAGMPVATSVNAQTQTNECAVRYTKEQTQAKLAEAGHQLNAANTAKGDAEAAVIAAEEKLAELLNAEKEAEAAHEEAKKAYDEAVAADKEAKAELNAAQKHFDQLKKEYSNAKKAAEELMKQEKAAAQKAYENTVGAAQAKVDSAKTEEKNALTEWNNAKAVLEAYETTTDTNEDASEEAHQALIAKVTAWETNHNNAKNAVQIAEKEFLAVKSAAMNTKSTADETAVNKYNTAIQNLEFDYETNDNYKETGKIPAAQKALDAAEEKATAAATKLAQVEPNVETTMNAHKAAVKARKKQEAVLLGAQVNAKKANVKVSKLLVEIANLAKCENVDAAKVVNQIGKEHEAALKEVMNDTDKALDKIKDIEDQIAADENKLDKEDKEDQNKGDHEEDKPGSKPESKPESNGGSKSELPQTGEGSTFAIYGAAALSVLAGLGLVAKKREEA